MKKTDQEKEDVEAKSDKVEVVAHVEVTKISYIRLTLEYLKSKLKVRN